MDDANRRGLERAFHDMRTMAQQNTQNHVQNTQGAQPEQYANSPRPHPSNARIFSPVPLPSNEQSQALVSTTQPAHQGASLFLPNGVVYRNAATTSQSQASTSTTQTTRNKSTVFLPTGEVSCKVPSASQLEISMVQHVYQPAQQQLASGLGLSSSLDTTNQRVYQPTQMRHSLPHGQFSRGSQQPRYHPYEVPLSRTPHGPPGSCSQTIFQVSLPNDSTSSPGHFYGTTHTQSRLPAIPQVRTPDDQNRLYRLYESRLRQQRANLQTLSSNGVIYSPRGSTPVQMRQPSPGTVADDPPLPRPHAQGPVRSYSRIQVPSRGISQAPTGSRPQSPTPSTPKGPLPNVPVSVPRPQAQSRPGPQGKNPSQNITKPVTQNTSHASPPNVSTPSHPPQALPQSSPSPPRVWKPELQTVTYGQLRLQAQPASEANHPSQKELVDTIQVRSYEKLRPHEFMDYLTMAHNACFRSGGARVFDMLFMQTLLFAKDQVLLVTGKLQTPCWEPPQSIWHANDVSGVSADALILEHMFKALNTVSDLRPSEISPCAGHQRYDSPVNVVKENGNLICGWSLTMSCEIKPQFSGFRLRNCSQELNARFFNEKQVETLRMDPVWKTKVLKIFEVRRNARDAKREDSLMNR